MKILLDQHDHEYGTVDIVEVDDGKYSFVVHDNVVVQYRRYGEKWNNDEIFMIKYNRAFSALVLETVQHARVKAASKRINNYYKD